MVRHPFVVSVTGLRKSPGARQPEHRRGSIDGLAVSSSAVPAGAEVDLDVILESVDGGIVVAGTVATRWLGECRRCLRQVEGDLGVEVRELYEVRGPDWRPSEADEETYPLTGEQIDLAVLAHDAVLLNLPLAPLCRPDCAGLCPSCGADRNEDACDCTDGIVDARWSGLDVLRPSEFS
jgi:uncharacterized protein